MVANKHSPGNVISVPQHPCESVGSNSVGFSVPCIPSTVSLWVFTTKPLPTFIVALNIHTRPKLLHGGLLLSSPRIILFDLEIIPNLQEALKAWTSLSSYPGITLRASITSIACMGWKVFGEEAVHCINAWDYPEWLEDVNNDRRVVEAAYEVLHSADCVISHNGKRFDWKFLQTRLLYHGMTPLPKMHHVDTCAEAKKNIFALNNRLNTLAQFLTDEEKLEHGEGWKLWIRTYNRDKEAQDLMERYCKQDVLVTEKVFRKLRPMINSLPNFNLFSPLKEKACPNCGSSRLASNGKRYTATRVYRRYLCHDCKKWSHTDLKDEVPR